MSIYWFELEIGPVSDLEEAAERLYSRCGDGQLSGDEQGGTVLFSREARNATEAILSAIDDSERSGLSVTGVMEDLVTIDNIAEKTGRSAPAVGHWTTGERGPGDFPSPIIHRGSRVKLYSWAQVSRWLADAGSGRSTRLPPRSPPQRRMWMPCSVLERSYARHHRAGVTSW